MEGRRPWRLYELGVGKGSTCECVSGCCCCCCCCEVGSDGWDGGGGRGRTGGREEETTAEKDGRALEFAPAVAVVVDAAAAESDGGGAPLLDPGRVLPVPVATSGRLKLKVAEGTRKDWPEWWWKCC